MHYPSGLRPLLVLLLVLLSQRPTDSLARESTDDPASRESAWAISPFGQIQAVMPIPPALPPAAADDRSSFQKEARGRSMTSMLRSYDEPGVTDFVPLTGLVPFPHPAFSRPIRC